ncbi:hypothetical protein EYZ11_009309 [Aspergillus tanneri]|uniref:Uncharacterized protein n=1 Tax=Aspergillus tanneri TaxID=1220188 RepID=A0A4S3J882_9EURO|nr:hypothetical protein EYZ11_009309 [Aspergillus tanneri]
MYTSDFPHYATEATLSNDSLNYNLFDTQRIPDFQSSPYRPTQMMTEQFVNRWQDVQAPSASLGHNARISQDVEFENSLQKPGNSRPQERTPSVESGDDITLGELRLMKSKYDQLIVQMDKLTRGLKQLALRSARVDDLAESIDNLAERIYRLENLPVQMESLQESTKRMDMKLHERCEEMRNEVKRIDRVVNTVDDCRLLDVGGEVKENPGPIFD